MLIDVFSVKQDTYASIVMFLSGNSSALFQGKDIDLKPRGIRKIGYT